MHVCHRRLYVRMSHHSHDNPRLRAPVNIVGYKRVAVFMGGDRSAYYFERDAGQNLPYPLPGQGLTPPANKQEAAKRFKKQPAKPTAEQMAEPRSDSDFESDSGFKNPPPSKATVSILKENARAREARQMPKYDTAVGLQIDWRKWCKARDELQLKLSHGWGAELTQEQLFQQQCLMAGVTAKVGWELAKRALEIPDSKEASA